VSDIDDAIQAGKVYLGPTLFADQGHQRFVFFPKIVRLEKDFTATCSRIRNKC
jgi:hypothetical protein